MPVIAGLTVCVGYDDLLAASINRWANGLDRVIVVTSMRDKATAELAGRHEAVRVMATDMFYSNGASFNKAAAIEQARPLAGDDWVLLFDADILPPPDIGHRLASADLKRSCLHGCWRRQCDTPMELAAIMGVGAAEWDSLATKTDRKSVPCNGFFQLFHAGHVSEGPWFPGTHKTAGGYDSRFFKRWRRRSRITLPFDVVHIGEPNVNWAGRTTGRWDDASQ